MIWWDSICREYPFDNVYTSPHQVKSIGDEAAELVAFRSRNSNQKLSLIIKKKKYGTILVAREPQVHWVQP